MDGGVSVASSRLRCAALPPGRLHARAPSHPLRLANQPHPLSHTHTEQVQYSLLDRRPENGMADFCAKHNITLLP